MNPLRFRALAYRVARRFVARRWVGSRAPPHTQSVTSRCPAVTPSPCHPVVTLTRLSRKVTAFCTLASLSAHSRNMASNASEKNPTKPSRATCGWWKVKQGRRRRRDGRVQARVRHGRPVQERALEGGREESPRPSPRAGAAPAPLRCCRATRRHSSAPWQMDGGGRASEGSGGWGS